jgi:hypothetical protein
VSLFVRSTSLTSLSFPTTTAYLPLKRIEEQQKPQRGLRFGYYYIKMKLACVIHLGAAICFYLSTSAVAAQSVGHHKQTGEEMETYWHTLLDAISFTRSPNKQQDNLKLRVGAGTDDSNVDKVKQTATEEGVGSFLPVPSSGRVGEGRGESNVAKVQTTATEGVGSFLSVPSSGHDLEQSMDQIRKISDYLKEKDDVLSELETSEFPALQNYVDSARGQLKGAFKEMSTLVDLMSSNLEISSQGSTETDTVTELETVFQRRMNEFPHENGSNSQKKKHRHDQTWDKFHSSSSHRSRHILEMQESMLNGDSSFFDRNKLHSQARSRTSNGRRMSHEDGSEKYQQCKDLVKCSKAMSLYDLFVYYYSDDIDPSTGTIDDNIKTFDEGGEFAAEGLFEKQANIRLAILAADTMVEKGVAGFEIVAQEALKAGRLDPCDLLLQEFHRNIEFDGSVNWQGAMVNQVCLAEGTTVYVKPTEIEKVTNKEVATQVFAELVRCGRRLFSARLIRAEIGSYNVNEPFVFIVDNKIRIPTGFDLTAATRNEHGQLLSSEKYPFTFDSYSLEGFRNINYDPIVFSTTDEWREDLCQKKVEDYYLQIFLKSETGTEVHYPTVSILGTGLGQGCDEDETLWNLDLCVRYEFRLVTENPVANVAEPDCESWYLDYQYGPFFSLECFDFDSGGCYFPYYSVESNDNFFSTGSVTVEALEEAAILVFGDQPSPGFVCGNADAVINDQKFLPGYCCLDAPYQSDPWGQAFSCDTMDAGGMKSRKSANECKIPGPYLAGLNTKACNAYGGTWCPSPQDCRDLQDCIAEEIQIAEEFNHTAFAMYLKAAPSITRPEDSSQCGAAKQYFGFDAFFLNDDQICEDILQLRNSRDFDFLDAFFKQGDEATCDREANPNGCNSVLLKEPLLKGDFPPAVNNGQIWRNTNWVLSQISEGATFAGDLIGALDCPSEPISNAFCIAITNFSEATAIILAYALGLVAAISGQAYAEVAELGNVEPWEIYENTNVIFKNMETTINTAVSRFDTADTNVASLQTTAVNRFDTVDTNVAALQTTSDLILKELRPIYLEGVKNAGCDGIDQDGDLVADNCEEDEFPPSLFHRDGLAISSTCPVAAADYCLEPTFKTMEDAKAYLQAFVKVEDDCASPDNLVTDILTTDLQLCGGIITMTPVHKHPLSSSCYPHNSFAFDNVQASFKGKPETFAVKVDGSAPVITCGFKWASKPRKTRLENSSKTLIFSYEIKSDFVDTLFFYDIQVNIRNYLSALLWCHIRLLTI